MYGADSDRSRRRAGETADAITFRDACLTVGTQLFIFPLAVQNDTEVKMCGTECAVCGCGEVLCAVCGCGCVVCGCGEVLCAVCGRGEVLQKGAERNLWT